LSLAATPDRIAAMRRTLAAATPAARAGIDEVSRLLDLDPESFGPDGVESSPLLWIADRFGAMAAATNRYAAWAQLERLHGQLINAGVPELAERMQAGILDGQSAAVELRFARAERLWRIALENS